MKMNYETQRLELKVLPNTSARQVLQFYLANQEIFEKYETDRPKQFYTEKYQKTLLQCEYNLTIKQSAVRFWVFRKENITQIIGTVSVQEIRRGSYQSCILGYKFDHRFWRQGYAKESLLKCIEIIFDEMKLHRIEAHVLPENIASKRLLLGLGFVPEGVKRQSVKFHGIWQDHEIYALLEGEN
ncbi:GNAT family protein [Lachnospiraceae bacterium 66-29]